MQDRSEAVELRLLKSNESQKWRRLFQRFDEDGDGKIPVREFEERVYNELLKHQVPLDALRDLLRNADQNQDGCITMDEFVKMVESKLGRKIFGEVLLKWYMSKLFHKTALDNMYGRRSVRNDGVRVTADGDNPDSVYRDEFRWCPPPLAMITASTIQILLFCFTFDGMENLLKNQVSFTLVYNPYRRREVWRYLTYMLIHGGWSHLLLNVLVQILCGFPLELVHRWWRVTLIYLVGVIAGSLGASVADPKSYICGASGGVYALILAHIAAIVLNWSEMEYPGAILTIFLVVMTADTGNAIYLRYFENVDTKVSYAAHIYGALTGLFFGLSILRNLEVHKWEKRLKNVAMTLYAILIATLIVWNIFFPKYFPRQDDDRSK